MNYAESLIPGNFINRDNRFRATVLINSQHVWAHVANTGRMRELLTPDVKIWLTKANDPNRKTAYNLKLIDHNGVLVSVDSRLPNPLFEEALLAKKINGFDYPIIRREVTKGHSRLDF